MISVIIPTRDRSALLTQCLNGLFCQRTDVPYEVLIGDDFSSFDVAACVAAHPLAARVRVRSVRAAERGAAAARNAAAALAEGSILGLLDDDAVPDAHWIEVIHRELDRNPSRLAAVTGRIFPLQTGLLSDARQARYDERRERALMQPGRRVSYLAGGNCAIRADVFHALSGFDPRCIMMHDRELVMRLSEGGWVCCYVDDLVIHHVHVKETFDAFVNAYSSGSFRRVLESIHPSEKRPITDDANTLWRLLRSAAGGQRDLSLINALLHCCHVAGYVLSPALPEVRARGTNGASGSVAPTLALSMADTGGAP